MKQIRFLQAALLASSSLLMATPQPTVQEVCNKGTVQFVVSQSEYCPDNYLKNVQPGVCVVIKATQGSLVNCSGAAGSSMARVGSVAAFGDAYTIDQTKLPAALTIQTNVNVSIVPTGIGMTAVYGFMDVDNVENRFIMTTFDASNFDDAAAIEKQIPAWMTGNRNALVAELQEFGRAGTPYVAKIYYWNPNFDRLQVREIGNLAVQSAPEVTGTTITFKVTPERILNIEMGPATVQSIDLNNIDLAQQRLDVLKLRKAE